MTEIQTGEELTSLDEEISALLAVEPEPDFLARMRTRVVREAAPVEHRLSWLLLGAAIAAACVLLAVLVEHQGSSPRVTRNVPARALSAGLASFAPSVARHEIRTTGVRGLIPVHVAGEPDVLVSRTESDALKRLLARAQQGSVDLAPLLESVPEEIAIPSIVIDTLEPVSGEGVRQ